MCEAHIISQGTIIESRNLDKYHADLWLGGETSFLIMTRGRNIFLIRGKTVFLKYEEGRNVLPYYEMGAKQVYEICFGCQMFSWNMVRVANVFLKYKHWSETSFLCIGRGRNVFYKYEMGAKVSLNNGANWLWGKKSVHRVVGLTRHPSVCGCQLSTVCSGSNHTMTTCGWQPSTVCSTLIPRATLRGVAELKESFSFKTRMPGTVKCRPTVAYWVQIDGINIATELITRYYSNETLIQCCFNVRPTSATLAQPWTNIR